LIEVLQQTLTDPAIIARFRVNPTDWTRQRTLTFRMVALLILQGHKQALQNTLNKCFRALGAARQVPTASALCQARQKLQPELFLHLNQLVTEHFYQRPASDCAVIDAATRDAATRDAATRDTAVPVPVALTPPASPTTWWTWRGHRLLGVDGTRWNLPDTPPQRDHFGSAKNQHDAVGCAQAQGSVLYDVLNDIGLSAVLEPIQAEKDLLFAHHLKPTQPGDVIIMDRGYADYAVLAFWVGHKREFVVRLPRSSFGPARAFWQSEAREAMVTITVTPDQRAFVAKHKLPTSLCVRLVKLRLETGEEEVLATSLVDATRYPAAELGQVYAWRWRTESYLDRLKNIFEIERLGSRRREHLQQDFYGVVFLATLESVLTRPANWQLAQASQRRGCRYVRQVNRAVSYSALLEQTLGLLSDKDRSPEQALAELFHLFHTNPVPRRPGRHVERKRRTLSQKLRYHRYGKRALT
jgi:hypothetical protein